MTNEEIFRKLIAFAESRPGFDTGDYVDAKSYRADTRKATRDLHRVRKLASQIHWRSTVVELIAAELRGGRGRLRLDSRGEIEYCAGQYYCVEFRRAIVALIETAIRKADRGDS